MGPESAHVEISSLCELGRVWGDHLQARERSPALVDPRPGEVPQKRAGPPG